MKISGRTTAQRNTVNVREGWTSRYAEGIVDELRTTDWTNRPGYFRSYYHSRNNQLLYQLFDNIEAIDICLQDQQLRIAQKDNFLLVAALSPIGYEKFNELTYAMLLALGFVSGDFLQGEVFTFRIANKTKKKPRSYHYHSLRRGGSSIYEALVWNPFAYTEMIGRPMADRLYKNKTLIPLDSQTYTELARKILEDHHFKYAMVLFNDANEGSQSLLVRNNCFFIVMEVLRKTFYEQVKDHLPKNYNNQKHLEKFRTVFEAIAPITDEEAELIALRNTFMHGDIKNIEGEEMMGIMHRQISLIYKLILTYIGFRGHVINHFYLRTGPANKAFTKLIPGFAASDFPNN